MSYINGIGLISPQKTTDDAGFLTEICAYNADFLRCIEPHYKAYIDPLQARRMSRLIKMGITSAKICLQDAGCDLPDAIITGTGLGSVEDTEKILATIHLDQPFLNPTPFMQSTYNTISSQIAINLKCHGYNSTYVHRTFSFESSLQDALLQLEEGSVNNALVCGIDEMTINHLNIIRRLGQWKMEPVDNLDLLKLNTPGALAGEGSACFFLSSEKNERTYAALRGVETIYKPGGQYKIKERITRFLSGSGLNPDDLDVVILGISGDPGSDSLYYQLMDPFFSRSSACWYKHLCGEYHTSSGFALWLAANMIKHQAIPPVTLLKDNSRLPVKNILIYNHYRDVNHSMMLVTM